MATASPSIKPIVLYDHLPGILAAYPAVLFAILALLAIPKDMADKARLQKLEAAVAMQMEKSTAASGAASAESGEAIEEIDLSESWWSKMAPNPHVLFWIGLSIMLVWYLAFRFNMPKNKFC